MATVNHKITAPIGVEIITPEQAGLEKGLRITAWAEEAWPDYIAVQDRITGRVRYYETAVAFFDAGRYRRTVELLEHALANIKSWGEPHE